MGSASRRIQNILVISLFLVFSQNANSEALAVAPAKLRAALFLKILGFNKNLTGDLSVYVLGDAEFATEIKKGIGKNIGKGKLTSVDEGDDVPAAGYSILYCGVKEKLSAVTASTRSQKIISISGIPDVGDSGVTLVVALVEGKPKILLNLNSSKEEGIDWNPAILKIATVIK